MRAHHLVLGTALTLSLLSVAPARAALNSYITIKGDKQGEIKGDVVQKGREGKILCNEFQHQVTSPRDAISGAATGRRIHGPVVATTEWGSHLPRLFNAFVGNENLSEVRFEFWRPSPIGAEQQYMTIKLTNARITSIKSFQPNTRNPDEMKLPEYSEVTFSYQKIEITYTIGGVTAIDQVASAVETPSRTLTRSATPKAGPRREKPVRTARR